MSVNELRIDMKNDEVEVREIAEDERMLKEEGDKVYSKLEHNQVFQDKDYDKRKALTKDCL